MHASFVGLLSGLFFSILLVYLLIVVNFQSWLDPFPDHCRAAGRNLPVIWMLFITGHAYQRACAHRFDHDPWAWRRRTRFW